MSAEEEMMMRPVGDGPENGGGEVPPARDPVVATGADGGESAGTGNDSAGAPAPAKKEESILERAVDGLEHVAEEAAAAVEHVVDEVVKAVEDVFTTGSDATPATPVEAEQPPVADAPAKPNDEDPASAA